MFPRRTAAVVAVVNDGAAVAEGDNGSDGDCDADSYTQPHPA